MAADHPAVIAAARIRSTERDRSMAVATLVRGGSNGLAAFPTEQNLSARDRHSMLADAMKRSSQNITRDHILRSLTDGGFSQSEASGSLETIERQLEGKRRAFERSRRRALALAYLQIVASLVFVILGVAMGRVPSVVIFGITALRGIHRLHHAQRQSFGTYVLAHR